jgi:thiamine pyrophosphate-dependent acetolactate synthase large subunit-like protein
MSGRQTAADQVVERLIDWGIDTVFGLTERWRRSTARGFRPASRIEEAARLLSGAEKPLIFIGAGARGAGAEVEHAAEALGAPIVKAMLGKDAVPDDSP